MSQHPKSGHGSQSQLWPDLGNSGDVKPAGEGVSELRIFYGPGYCVYFARRGDVLVILLCGGDKSTQDRDVKMAKALARELDKEAKDGH